MKIIVNLLIGIALVCFLIAVISKVGNSGLYDLGIQPISGLVFGNSCLLLALVLNSIRK